MGPRARRHCTRRRSAAGAPASRRCSPRARRRRASSRAATRRCTWRARAARGRAPLAALPGDVNVERPGATRPSWSLPRRRGDASRAAATARLRREGADPMRRRPTEAAGVLRTRRSMSAACWAATRLPRALRGHDAWRRWLQDARQSQNCFHAPCDRGHARCLQAVLAACGASSEGTRAAARSSAGPTGGRVPDPPRAHSGAAACVRLLDFDACPSPANERVASGRHFTSHVPGHLETAGFGTTCRGKRPAPNSRRSTRRPGTVDVCALVPRRGRTCFGEDPDHRTPLATAVSHGTEKRGPSRSPAPRRVTERSTSSTRPSEISRRWPRGSATSAFPPPTSRFRFVLRADRRDDVRALLRTGAAADVVAIRALGDAPDGADDAAPAPPPPPLAAATQPGGRRIFPRAARVRATPRSPPCGGAPGFAGRHRVPVRRRPGSARVDEQAALPPILGRRLFSSRRAKALHVRVDHYCARAFFFNAVYSRRRPWGRPPFARWNHANHNTRLKSIS